MIVLVRVTAFTKHERDGLGVQKVRIHSAGDPVSCTRYKKTGPPSDPNRACDFQAGHPGPCGRLVINGRSLYVGVQWGDTWADTAPS